MQHLAPKSIYTFFDLGAQNKFDTIVLWYVFNAYMKNANFLLVGRVCQWDAAEEAILHVSCMRSAPRWAKSFQICMYCHTLSRWITLGLARTSTPWLVLSGAWTTLLSRTRSPQCISIVIPENNRGKLSGNDHCISMNMCEYFHEFWAPRSE